MASRMTGKRRALLVWLVMVVVLTPWVTGLSTNERKWTEEYKEKVREMFQHAYNGYLRYAYPLDELQPISCTGVDTWGSFSLTLIDALDTLLVMGNVTEFQNAYHRILANPSFNIDINTSVFEANIRVVGGLLSGHLLSPLGKVPLAPGWPCEGPLLNMAESLANRLLPAFDTPTGLPYGTVNLRYGVPPGETPVTCTACCSSFLMEFGTLSRLTGNPVFEETALRAVNAVLKHQTPIGLVGNHIDVITGKWTAVEFSTGNYIDSFLEYLVKGSVLLGRGELMTAFNKISKAIFKYTEQSNWYIWVHKDTGQASSLNFEALGAYWPGVLSMVGELKRAQSAHMNHYSVWRRLGGLPEIYNILNRKPLKNFEAYRLRPELVEATWYLYQATGNPLLLEFGRCMVDSINSIARTPCGFATVHNVSEHTLTDRMESYFLAETLKYLYLLFDADNFLSLNPSTAHKLQMSQELREAGAWHLLYESRRLKDGCTVGQSGYVLTTEAHPIDIGALHCCKHKWRGVNEGGLTTENGCPASPFHSRLEIFTATL